MYSEASQESRILTNDGGAYCQWSRSSYTLKREQAGWVDELNFGCEREHSMRGIRVSKEVRRSI